MHWFDCDSQWSKSDKQLLSQFKTLVKTKDLQQY
jgi:hypothetical protein